MTDQKQDNNQRGSTRRLNGRVIFCALCLILAIGIYLAGGSAIFASLFGAISLYGLVGSWLNPLVKDTSYPEETASFQASSELDGHENDIHAAVRRNNSIIHDPEYGFLSTNVFHRSRNPTKYNDDYD